MTKRIEYTQVKEVYYTEGCSSGGTPGIAGPDARVGHTVDILRVIIDWKGNSYNCDFLNEEFTIDNPSLKMLAYLDLRPSDTDFSAELEVPVLVKNGQLQGIAKRALREGEQLLRQKEWAPVVEGEKQGARVYYE